MDLSKNQKIAGVVVAFLAIGLISFGVYSFVFSSSSPSFELNEASGVVTVSESGNYEVRVNGNSEGSL